MADTTTKENILILGATGYIGAPITEKIVQAKEKFGRIAIFTSENTAKNKPEVLDRLRKEGVEVIIGDVDNKEELSKAFEGITTLVSAVGRNAIASQISWLRLAASHPSIKRFFPSEYGTDIEYDASSATEIPHQQKLKVRAALKELGGKGLDYTYVVTGPYADVGAYLSNWPGERAKEIGSFDVKGKKAWVLGDGKGRVSLTTKPDVGKFVVAALLHPSESKNKALKVNSFTTTPLEIVAEFEKQTGGEKWEVNFTSFEKLREWEKEAIEAKNPFAVGFTLKRIWGEGGTLYEKRDNWLIDVEDTETLEDAVRVVVAAAKEDRKGNL